VVAGMQKIFLKRDFAKKNLPHLGVGEFCETEKTYFFGYVFFGQS
jgi:hypothetical protein